MSRARPPGPDRAPAPAKPVLLSKGRYAIYQAPNGDGVISYRPENQDFDQRQVVPARFWAVMTGIASGEIKDMNPVTLMKMIMAGK